MSVETEPVAKPAGLASPPPVGRHAHTYTLTWSGIWAVAKIDRKRLFRGPKTWTVRFTYLVLFTLLATVAYIGAAGIGGTDPPDRGASMFGVMVYMVLAISFAITPLLSATAINGDAHNNVLSTLQRTQLSPAEIAIGKLLSAWMSALLLMVLAMPGLLWAYFQGGTSIARMLITLAVTSATMLAGCAIGLGWSSLVPKVGSAMLLTALTLGIGAVGLPVLHLMLLPLTEQTDQVTVSSVPSLGSPDIDCVTETRNIRRPHGEKIWWLLAVSPMAIVADASPARQVDHDPLTYVRETLRSVRLPPPESINNCAGLSEQELERQIQRRDGLPPTWPLGVFVDVVLTLLFLQLAIERLRNTNTRPPVRGSVA